MADNVPTCLDVHPKNPSLIVIGYSNGLLEITGSGGEPAKRVGSVNSEAKRVRWAPDGSMKLACASGDVTVVFEKLGDIWATKNLKGHSLEVSDLSWSSDSKKIATSSLDSKIIIWDVNQQRQLSIISASSWVKGCAIDPAHRYLAGCVADVVVLWRISDGVEHDRIALGSESSCVDWSPDGKYLCCGSVKGKVLLVDRMNSTMVSLQGFGSERISQIRFSPTLYRQAGSLGAIVCIASNTQIVVFYSRSATAIESWSEKNCDDIAWAGPVRVALCSKNGPLEKTIKLPDETQSLTADEVADVLNQTYGARLDGGLGGKQDSFCETVTQMEVEERAKMLERQQQETTKATTTTAPTVPTQQRETMTKSGKKRIQPINASSASSLSNDATSISTTLPEQTMQKASTGAVTIPSVTPVVAAGNGSAAPPPPPPPPPPGGEMSVQAVPTSSSGPAPALDDVDCGKCKYCLDKPKFGGKNALRQRCMNRPPLPKRARNTPAVFKAEEEVSSAEEDGEDGWGSHDELDPDSENELGPFVLTPLQFTDAYYADSQHQQHSYVVAGKFTVNFSSKNRQRTMINCYNNASNERMWAAQVRGVILGFACDETTSVFATSLQEIHVHSTKHGAPYLSPIALGSACSFLEFSEKGDYLSICTREGRLTVLSLKHFDFLLSEVPLAPLMQLRGKPFTLNDISTEPGSRSCVLHISSKGVPVLMIANRRDSSCAAFAYVSKSNNWLKILDPSRFIGSEFCSLHRATMLIPTSESSKAGEIESLHRKLLHGLISVTSASQAAQALIASTGDVTLAQTINHVESLIYASRIIQSESEERFWLCTLFDRFSKDYANYQHRAKWWTRAIEQYDTKFEVFVRSELIPRLAKNREYQTFIEEWHELRLDKGLAINGL